MRKNLIAVLFVVVLLVGVGLYRQFDTNQVQQTTQDQQDNGLIIGRVGEGYFNFEIADDIDERTQGLSGRDKLSDTDALLFVFERSDNHCFWMKDMKFNIDILWFDENKVLVYEKRDISPSSFPENFCPNMPTKYVVEVAAGVAEKNQIQRGSILDIEL